MYNERKMTELDIKWYNTCWMFCARCISYGTGECDECCDTNNIDCKNCLLRDKQIEQHSL